MTSTPRRNALGQPIGEPLDGWEPRPLPPPAPLEGRLCRLEPLDPARHLEALFAANSLDADGRNWTYLPYGPWDSIESYGAWFEAAAASADPLWFAIVSRESARAIGVASYLRIDPANGAIEVGHLAFSPLLQRTAAATEALYLLARRAFEELGYRRLEWKCDSFNEPSRAAALRLGFRYEGMFRQAVVMKGRNRDNAWFSMLDGEWPAVRAALEAWLDPANFDEQGRQRRALSALLART